MKLKKRLAVACAAALCAQIAFGQVQFPGSRGSFTNATFEARRAKLAKAIPQSLVVLFGTKSLLDTWEEQRYNAHWHVESLRQDENLFYLSGFDAPSVAAIFDTDTKVMQIYAPSVTAATAEETKRLDLPPARSLEQFEMDLDHAGKRPAYIESREGDGGPEGAFVVAGTAVGTFSHFLPGGTPGTYREDQIKAGLTARFPHVDFRSLLPVIRAQRKYLDAQEIAAMRKSVAISVEALTAGIRAIRPGVQDIQIGAIMECTMRMNGSQTRAYAPDIQTGPNAVAWYTELFDQYDLANRVMQAKDMALIDQGAEYSYYQSDLARVVPVSGKYTDEQRLIYRAYQKAWEAGLATFRPGKSMMQVGAAAADAMTAQINSLPEWVRPTARQFADATRSGPPGHFLSTTLDLHRDIEQPFEPGQAMAYEIHWFVPERNWRFTIEDDILITPTGHEDMAEGLPRNLEDLERLMAHPTPISCSAPAQPVALRNP